MHSWSTFGAWTNHEQTWTHKIHHDSVLGEAITFLLIIFFVLGHGVSTQMSFCPKTPNLGISKFSKLRFSQFWRPITFYANLWLRWSLMQSCNPFQKLSKDMWHATSTQLNYGDSKLLVVTNQIGNLIFDPSFGHNLCFKYPNGSCEPILDI